MITSVTAVQHLDERPILSRVALGTAQMGLPYGATNRHPLPVDAEVEAMLDLATASGIDWIDTAPAYGDAELRLGRHLGRHPSLRVATKVGALTDVPVGKIVRAVHESVYRSAERLGRERIDLLLLHQVGDLSRPDADELVEALAALKAEGIASRLGVSVYDPEDLDAVMTRKLFDVVQAPLNPLDRRFATDEVLQALDRSSMVLHARSLFLQGLLVAPAADLPDFARHHPSIEAWRAWLRNHASPIAGCLRLVLALPRIERAVVGIATAAQLQEVISAAASTDELPIFNPPPADPFLLDPRRWPPRTTT
jgi:hypothetical protein